MDGDSENFAIEYQPGDDAERGTLKAMWREEARNAGWEPLGTPQLLATVDKNGTWRHFVWGPANPPS